ncbi:unnamed protein product [Caenorhabditis bovis]|uniref:DEP domain-containing protein n=1 Tax=Caenorhabditis bovis TaxID=2654633 RepID=A0A8S1F3C7_9PELO|nr:unnamed protein product [Caenorhabditis bovis]
MSASPNLIDTQQHSIVLDDTPSPPPPKPPRGVMRQMPPMKPQRSALKIEPLDEKENGSAEYRSQFKAKETMDKMMSYFKRSIGVIRNSGEFTGAEAANILEVFILKNKECFKREDVGRKNAVLLLDLWREQNIIKSVDPSIRKFIDSEHAYYILSDDDSNQRYYCAPSPIRAHEETPSLVSRSSGRSNSFKRLFSPLGNIRRNRSNSRGRKEEKEKESNSTFLRSTWSLFTSDKHEKKSKQIATQAIKEEEARIYELSLLHLLNIIEVEFLEDFALPVDDSKKNASFLSSILDKMKIGGSEERLDYRKEDEMDLLVETHPIIREASAWFQMARLCAPTLYLEQTSGKSSVMQLYLWCKAALAAVSAKLEKMTQNGASPLIPNEFSAILGKIAEQLINNLDSGEKLNLAVLYLFLMIPSPLRSMIDNIVQWLQITMRTNAVEDLRSPFYLGRKEPKNKENCRVIIDELRSFIFPRGCMTNNQQDIFIETLVELRTSGRLGKLTPQLEESLRAKCVRSPPKRRWRSRKRSAPENVTPVRFAVQGKGLRPAKQETMYEGLDETEKELVKMIELVIEDKKMSLTLKQKQLESFSKTYPKLYQRYFSNLL